MKPSRNNNPVFSSCPDPRLSEAWNKIATAKSTLRRIERRLDDYHDPHQVALTNGNQFSLLPDEALSTAARKISRLDDKYRDVTRQPLSPVSPNLRHPSPANQRRVSFSPTNQKRVSFSDSPPLVKESNGAELRGGVFANAPDFSPIKGVANDDVSDDVYNLTDSRAIRETEIRFLNDDPYLASRRSPLGQGHLDIGQGRTDKGQRERKGLLEVDADGLSRIKYLIEEQKRQLSAASQRVDMDREIEERRQLAQRQRHADDDVIVPVHRETWAREPVQVMPRKVAAGPATPHYPGFNEPETRYRHAGEPSTSRAREQHTAPTANTRPSKPIPDSKPPPAKPKLPTEAKPKPEVRVTKTEVKVPKPEVKVAKPEVKVAKPETDAQPATNRAVKKPVKHVGLITTSSWREGQKLIRKELGPMPKLREERRDAQEAREERRDSSEEREKRAEKMVEESQGLADDVKAVLEDLQLDAHPTDTTPTKKRTPTKRKLRPQTAVEEKQPAPAKVRHYDSEEMRKYIVKQQADRKKKQQEERDAKQAAAEHRRQQLAELAAKSKNSVKPKPTPVFGLGRGLDETFSKEPSLNPKFLSVDIDGAVDDDDSDTLTDHSQNDGDVADVTIPGVSPDVQEIIKEYRQSVRASRDMTKPRPSSARPSETDQSGGATTAQKAEPSGSRTKSQRLAALKQTATSLQARLDNEMDRLLEANFSPTGAASIRQRPEVLQPVTQNPLYAPPETAYAPSEPMSRGLQGSAPDVRRAPYSTRHDRLVGGKSKEPFNTDLPGVNLLRKSVSHDELRPSPNRRVIKERRPAPEDGHDRSLAESCDSLLESDLDLSEHINRKINKILQEETSAGKSPSSKPVKSPFNMPDRTGPLFKKAPQKVSRAPLKLDTAPKKKEDLFEMENDPYTVFNMFRRQQRRNRSEGRQLRDHDPSARSQSPLELGARSQSAGIPGYRSHSPLELRSQSASGSVESLPGKGQSASVVRSHRNGRVQSGRSYDDTFEEADSTILESESESLSKNADVPSLEQERFGSHHGGSSGRDQKQKPKLPKTSSRSESIRAEKSSPSYRGTAGYQPQNEPPRAPSNEGHQPSAPGAPSPRPRVQRLYEQEGRMSPGALERQLAAELYRLDGVEESVRQLTDVERARAVSLAQQETVSLAQILKARQQTHERELTNLQLKARHEAIAAEQSTLDQAKLAMDRNTERMTVDLTADRAAVLEAQHTSARLLQAQTEAAQITADAAKQISQVRASMLEQVALPVDESIRLATQTAQAAATGAVRAALRDSAKGKERASRSRHRSPPSARTTTYSDSYTESRSTPYTESRSAPAAKSSSSKTSSKTASTKVPKVRSPILEKDLDDDVTPHASDNDDTILTEEGASADKTQSISEDLPSEKVDDYTLSFDETMTEDEREDQSFRMLLPSEEHRRQAKRERSASSRDPSREKRHVTRSREPSKEARKDKLPSASSDDVSVSRHDESTAPLLAEDSFNKFTAALVQQYMKEEEVRAQHQVALLKLREKALKEKTKAEMAWLDQQKKRCRDKGADDIYPQIRKKQRGLIIKLQQEQAEIKRLRQANALATKERQLLLYQQQEINRLRQSAIQTREKMKHSASLHASDLAADTGDETSLAPTIHVSQLDDHSELSERLEASEPAKGKEKDYKSDSEVYNESSLRIPSSPDAKAMMKLKKMKIDPKYLTARERKLNTRRKQAESLLQWKQRLDQEEQEIQRMELKALKAHTEEGGKARKAEGRKVEKPILTSSGSRSETANKPLKAKPRQTEEEAESSIAEEISEASQKSEKAQTETEEIKTSSEIKNRNHQESGDEVTLVSTASARDQYSNDTFISEHSKPTTAHSAGKLASSPSAGAALRPSQSVPGGGASLSQASSTLAALVGRDKASSRNLFNSDKSLTPRSPRGVRRRETESESEDSLSCAHSVSETASVSDASDIELRIRALNEELRRRRSEADRLKRDQKKKRKDRLKAQEASLKKQLEAYDNFISQTKANLQKELEHEPTSKSTVKPQIKQPKVHADARRLKDALSRTPEAARPISGSDTGGSQSEGSSRSGSIDDVIETQTDVPTSPGAIRSSVAEIHEDAPEIAEVEARVDEGAESDSSGSTVKSEQSVLESPRKVAMETERSEVDVRRSESEIPTESLIDDTSGHEFLKLDLNLDQSESLPKLDLNDPKLDLNVPELDLNVPKLDLNVPKLDLNVPKLDLNEPKLEQNLDFDLGQETSRTVNSEILDESPRLENQMPTRSLDDVVIPPLDLNNDRWPISEKKAENVSDQSARSLHSSYSDDYSDDFSSDRGEKDGRLGAPAKHDDVTGRRSPVADDVSEHLSYHDSDSEGPPVLDQLEIILDLPQKSESEKYSISKKSEIAEDVSEASEIREVSVKSEISEISHKTEETREKFNLGDRVLIGGVKAGTVRYKGPFKFAPGHWLGVELDRPEGTNDGTVGGRSYFTAKPRHGIFAPVEKVTSYTDDVTKMTTRFVSVYEKPPTPTSELTAVNKDSLATPRELELSDFAALSQEEKREVVLRSLRHDEDEDESEISISSDLERAISGAALAVEQFSPPRSQQQSQQNLDSLVDKITSNLTHSVLSDSVGVIRELREKSPSRESQSKPLSQEELISDEVKPELIDEGEIDDDVGIASDVATKGLLDDAIDTMLQVRRRRETQQDQVSLTSSEHDSGIHGEYERRSTPASSVVSNESVEQNESEGERRTTSPVLEEASHRGRTPADLAEVARMLDHDLFDLETPVQDSWMDDDFGLGRREPPPPYPGSPPLAGQRPDFSSLQRLTDEVFYAVPHKVKAVTDLVGKVVDVYWKSRRYGEPLDDVTPPEDYFSDEETDLESKSRRVYKRMIFDLVGEHIREMYQNENMDEPTPAWVKHKLQPGSRLYRGRSPPTTADALKDILNGRVLKVLNLTPGNGKEKLKWQPSRKKNDHVDEILVEELREEETEWVNYDDDELAVKMQLTDAIFELLMQETVEVLGDIQTKVTRRANVES